jgi:hypothetical protein
MIDNENRDSQPLGDSTASGIGEDGGGPRLGGLSSELSAVMMSAGQCDVEVAGAYQPGIHGDAADNRIWHRGGVPEQLLQADLVSGARPNHAPP